MRSSSKQVADIKPYQHLMHGMSPVKASNENKLVQLAASIRLTSSVVGALLSVVVTDGVSTATAGAGRAKVVVEPDVNGQNARDDTVGTRGTATGRTMH
jgi:hypothetical protein